MMRETKFLLEKMAEHTPLNLIIEAATHTKLTIGKVPRMLMSLRTIDI